MHAEESTVNSELSSFLNVISFSVLFFTVRLLAFLEGDDVSIFAGEIDSFLPFFGDLSQDSLPALSKRSLAFFLFFSGVLVLNLFPSRVSPGSNSSLLRVIWFPTSSSNFRTCLFDRLKSRMSSSSDVASSADLSFRIRETRGNL